LHAELIHFPNRNMAPSKYNGMSNFPRPKNKNKTKLTKMNTIVLILSKGEKDGQIT